MKRHPGKGEAAGHKIFRVTDTDGMSGMSHEDVPDMMGRVLAVASIFVKQTSWSKREKIETHFPILQQEANKITSLIDVMDFAKQFTMLYRTLHSGGIYLFLGGRKHTLFCMSGKGRNFEMAVVSAMAKRTHVAIDSYTQ